MKKCPECGNELPDNALECNQCGCPLEDDFLEKEITNSEKKILEENNVEFSKGKETKESNYKNKGKKFLNLGSLCLGLIIGIILTVCVCTVRQNSITDTKEAEIQSLKKETDELENELSASANKYSELEENYSQLKTEYTEYQEEMKPYEEMEEAEAKQRKSEAEAQQKEQERQEVATEAVKKVWNFEAGTLQSGATRELCEDARSKVNELTDESTKQSLLQAVDTAEQTIAAQEQAAAEEEARGYETGITYDQLARTPDEYEGKKCKFSGKVLQVMESDDIVVMRLAVNGDYDTVLYCMYNSSLTNSRILEDDQITVYGTSSGIYTYTSTMGAAISIPSMVVDKIDQ